MENVNTKNENKKKNKIVFEEDNDKARRKRLRVWNLKSRSLEFNIYEPQTNNREENLSMSSQRKKKTQQ